MGAPCTNQYILWLWFSEKKLFHQEVMQNKHHELWLNSDKQISKEEWKITCVICGFKGNEYFAKSF